MKVLGTVTTSIDTYTLYVHGSNDFELYAHNGDWSVRGNKQDIEAELTELSLSLTLESFNMTPNH